MEQLKQTHMNMQDLFARLSVEKATLENAIQRCAEREVQDRELLSAVGEFAERQRKVEDDVRALLERQDESDKMLEESMILMLRQKRDKDQGIRREIEELFGASVQGAQEILRRFDIALEPVQDALEKDSHPVPVSRVSSPFSSFSDVSTSNSLDFFAFPGSQNSESVDKESASLTPLHTPKQPSSSLPPSPLPDVPETKPEPQEWDFVDYEDGVVLGNGAPKRKPPALFTESYESELSIPANLMPQEPVDDTVIIPITEWDVATSTRDIKVNGVRVLKNGILELWVTLLDGKTEPGALEELTHGLINYHRGTDHKLAGNFRQWDFVSAQSSHGTSWHRGQILEIIGRDAKVLFIDSGFHETISVKNLRPLPTLFRFLPRQARKARLSFIKLPDAQSQHYVEALEALQKACVGRTLAAKLDNEGSHNRSCVRGMYFVTELPLMELRLMDPAVDSDDILMSINGQLLREGLATFDNKLCRSTETYHSVPCLLAKAAVRARNEELGMYRR
ncbi:hypothetical protein EWM64_g7624 [Hericium alpestre]|uniref:Tudor domain-containing protein n=1 Tax=Hericium alpestre TaxID=135208 RepID=A0A4Y9ZSC0_9AGAM|nr:hypothetical protein EWM64_g7624 [Hericium alpestre]